MWCELAELCAGDNVIAIGVIWCSGLGLTTMMTMRWRFFLYRAVRVDTCMHPGVLLAFCLASVFDLLCTKTKTKTKGASVCAVECVDRQILINNLNL